MNAAKNLCLHHHRHGDGAAFQQNQYKTNSLPASSSLHQPSEEVIFSALMISPEDIANQLTLLDLPCFKEIKPEELLTCGWTKLNKAVIAPNVVAFTQRFNRVCKVKCTLISYLLMYFLYLCLLQLKYWIHSLCSVHSIDIVDGIFIINKYPLWSLKIYLKFVLLEPILDTG